MKSFSKSVLANIVAFMIIVAVFFTFILLMVLASVFSDNKKVTVRSESILTLDRNTMIIDSPTEANEGLFSFSEKQKKVLLYDVLQAVKNAKTDDNIKGISIETDLLSAGMTQVDDLRAALEDFKKSGKFVWAYGNTPSQSAYYLGSVADQYFLNPAGGIDLKGLSTELLYMKSFTEKYGIGMQVIRHGKYKSAVETFMRDDMSPENREQITAMVNDFWTPTAAKIATSRKMDTLQFRTVVDSLYGIIPDLSLQHRLADRLIQKTEYDDLLKSKLKVEDKKKLNKISFEKYIRSFAGDAYAAKEQVAVLYASGTIYNGEGYNDIYAENFVKEIKKLTENKKVKAVVLRVNSPGGSANASDEILFSLQELRKKKPLIVSFGDYAASGGYYIAMAGEKIFSEPNTLTGSIGVFGLIPNVKELAERNGFSTHVVSTNANSNMYSPLRGMTEGGVSILTRSVDQTYRRFVHFVSQNRKKTFEEVDVLGGGRVWSGQRARANGLVDELGTLENAISFAAKRANLEKYEVSAYPRKMSQFEQLFKNMDEEQLSARFLKMKLGEDRYKIFEYFTDPKTREGVRMETGWRISLD